HGRNFVSELNGMFAICLYDRQEHKLYLFRDRMVIKPLFWYSDREGNIAFASELKALTAFESISKEVNHESIFNFLRSGFIPSPFTIYKNIHKLESGTCLTVSRSGIEKNKICELTKQVDGNKLNNEKEVLVKLDSILTEAVKIQLRSDVPYGIFLSGGVDSSLVTALATKHVNGKLNTFSIGFREQTHNEAPHAR